MTRAEAIKKMQAVKAYMISGNPIWSITEMGETFDMAIKALEEPEIIRCKDCEHWRINYYQDVETCFEHRNIDGTEQATRPEDYCSMAKRRKE